MIKLGLAAAMTGGAVLGASEARADPANWSSFSDIAQIPAEFTQEYTSYSTVSLENNFSGVYFMITDIGSHLAVGGFDVCGGQITHSYFGNIGDAYTANSAVGSNPGNSLEGYWAVFYDANNDGNYGVADLDIECVFQDRNEQLDISQYAISGFTPFGTEPGTFTFTSNIPEPSAGTLTALGLSPLAFSAGTNIIHFQIAVTNLASFRLEYRDSLTNAAWASLGPYGVTGAVTTVVDTNTEPARFYRAVSP